MPPDGWCGAWVDDERLGAWRRELRYMLTYEEQGTVPANDREQFARRAERLRGFIAERVAR